MPLDLASLLAALGLGGGPTAFGGNTPNPLPPTGTSGVSPIPAGGIPTMMGALPNVGSPSQGLPVSAGAPGAASGLSSLLGGSAQGMPNFGLLGAGAAMLNASAPHYGPPAGLGQILGQGLGGFMQGQMTNYQLGQHQQQQDALAKIAQLLGRAPGASPVGGNPAPITQPPTGPAPTNLLPTPSGASIVGNQPPTGPMNTPRPPIPGTPPPGASTVMQPAQNPFIAMMLQRRLGTRIV